jgi:hypothetical protein
MYSGTMFRTEIAISPSPKTIEFNHSVICLGSCFSEIIGQNLSENKFKCLNNPFGTIFNPVALFRFFTLTRQELMSPSLFIENQEVFYHWYCHSKVSGITSDDLKSKLGKAWEKFELHRENVEWIIFSLGTAYGYYLSNSGELVSNCHKVPANQFNKRLLSVEEIVLAFEDNLSALLIEKPDVKVILTVSPVRHIKDGLISNQVSKSILRLAVHELTHKYEQVTYFPSYEILLDDLRDYRFYADDFIHPNGQAIDYIRNKFSETYFSLGTQNLIERWQKVKMNLNHQPSYPHSQKHFQHLNRTLNQLVDLNKEIDLKKEISELKDRIEKLQDSR